jgi:hypothetical protein
VRQWERERERIVSEETRWNYFRRTREQGSWPPIVEFVLTLEITVQSGNKCAGSGSILFRDISGGSCLLVEDRE